MVPQFPAWLDPVAVLNLPPAAAGFVQHVLRVLRFEEYNTSVVLLGTTLLGISAGVVGVFMLLRKRSLVGDVVGHASLPGIAIAFLLMEILKPGGGRWLPGLLLGALFAGAAGVAFAMFIERWTRLKEDAALAIVLSIFFGLGIALFTVIQSLGAGNAAGLNQLIFGKSASIVAADVVLIAAASAIVLAATLLLWKEFSLLCFDEDYAAGQGWPVVWLDVLLMGLVVGIAVIGEQSVGLLLVAAMLIIPAAASRFWTDRLSRMMLAAAATGGLGAMAGVLLSSSHPKLAAGPVIVLSQATIFTLSLLFGSRRGILVRALETWRLQRRVGRHDLLRSLFECLEALHPDTTETTSDSLKRLAVSEGQLLEARAWSRDQLRRLLRRAEREGLLNSTSAGYQLTRSGADEAQRAARNHRLWEIYLIQYADIAPGHVDRDADMIEHVLDQDIIERLDRILAEQHREPHVPASPHPVGGGSG